MNHSAVYAFFQTYVFISSFVKAFFLQRAYDLSSIMVDMELLSLCLYISPTQSSTYLPAYLDHSFHSFVCDMSNSVSLTVDYTFRNDTVKLSGVWGR